MKSAIVFMHVLTHIWHTFQRRSNVYEKSGNPFNGTKGSRAFVSKILSKRSVSLDYYPQIRFCFISVADP